LKGDIRGFLEEGVKNISNGTNVTSQLANYFETEGFDLPCTA
jgi:hypothetical protein